MLVTRKQGTKSMNIAKLLERLMGMDDATWARHANPWSGWTRVTILPLLSSAIWSRVWLGWGAVLLIIAVIVWTWVNPRLFGPPEHNRAWMTKGVLGERVWLAQSEKSIPSHHAKVGRMLILAAGLGILPLAFGLWHLDLGWTMVGLIAVMGAKRWFLDRMVWLLADTHAEPVLIEGLRH